MAISSSNFVSIAYGEETTEGEVPVLRETYYTGEGFGFTKQSVQSNNINSTRQVIDNVQVGFEVPGSINIEVAPKIYDDLIAGALWGAWSTAIDASITASVVAATRTYSSTGAPFTNVAVGQHLRIAGFANAANNGVVKVESVAADFNSFVAIDDGLTRVDETDVATITVRGSMIRNGVTRRTFFFERAHNDLVPRRYFSYNANLVNSFSINAQASALLTGAVQFIGKTSGIYNDGVYDAVTNKFGNGSGAVGSGTKSAGGTILPPLPFNGLNAVSHVGDIRINDIAINAGADAVILQKLDFAIGNNNRGVKGIGYLGNAAVSPGQLAVTGSIGAFFVDEFFYDKYLSDEEFSMSIALLDENQEGYVYSWPRMTLSTENMNASGKDQDLVEDAQWQALMDKTHGYTMQVDRIYNSYS